MSSKEQINDQLDNLIKLDGVQGSALVRRDGLSIASKFEEGVNSNQVGAMTASTVGSGKTAAQTLELGGLEEIAIKSENGHLVALGIGDEVILTLLIEEGHSLEDHREEVEQISDNIQQAL